VKVEHLVEFMGKDGETVRMKLTRNAVQGYIAGVEELEIRMTLADGDDIIAVIDGRQLHEFLEGSGIR
jgi:hypothetical protein